MVRALLRVVVALAVVASAAAGGVVAAAGADEAADTVTLTVTVVDGNGNPLSDAELTATWGDGAGSVTRTTAGNGKAFVDVAAGANVTIRVDHPSYVRNEPYRIRNATERDVTVDVRLKGRATVTVEDDDGPVSNAIVRMFKNGTVVNERTDDDGRLRTQAIERGEYVLVAFKGGYLRNRTTVDVGEETTTTIEIETGSVLVSLEVTDDHFDPPRPLANASVTVEGIGTVSTLGNGEATISVPVNRDFSVSVTKEGYGKATRSLSIRESPESLNLSISRVPAVSLDVANQRVVVNETVRATVTDEYGEPLEDVTVSIDDSSVGETNDDGVIDVPVDSPGNHTISVDTGRLQDSVRVVGVKPAPDETPTPTPTPTPEPTPTPAPTTTTSSGLGPGLGIVTGVVGVLSLAVVALRRRR